MRLKVYLETSQLPVSYRRLMLSLIKDAIRKGDEQLYNKLYVTNAHLPKRYSFAVFLLNFKKIENVFKTDGVTLTISTSDPTIAVALINGFQEIKEYTYQNEWTLKVSRVELAREKRIHHPMVRFETLSPILLEDRNKKPLLITDDRFETEMNIVTNQQFLAQYGRQLKKPLKIKGYRMKKQVVQEINKDTNEQILYYTGQKGTIIIEGHTDDLQLIYQDGLLKRKSQGFGLLEVTGGE